MKINGVRPDTPNEVIIPIPRGDAPPFVFIARAVTSWDLFYDQAPVPKAATIEKPGKEPQPNFNDPTYKKAVEKRSELWHAFLIVQSLIATPNLEWETIDLNVVESYVGYETELKQAFFSDTEISRIIAGCHEANAMNDDAIEKARADFLASRRLPKASE